MDVLPLLPDAPRWRPAPPGAAYDLETKDGRRILKVAPAAQGARDLHGGVVRLAQVLADRPGLGRAVLAVRIPRLSVARLRKEWESLGAILRPAIRDRLAIVFLGDDEVWLSDDDPRLRAFAEKLGEALRRTPASSTPSPSPRYFECFKLLLEHRLREGTPLGVGDLLRRSGFSHPTISDAVKRLEASGELVRRSRRSVEFAAFPRRSWAEILALSASLRRTSAFLDTSGRSGPLTALLGRVEKAAPPGVALGGVIAARHWDRDFDLHGLPRLDLVPHVAKGEPDLDWIRRLDPALQPTSATDPRAVLALHPLRRADARFASRKGRTLPVADPVETLLDLHEMGLHAQGDELIARLEASR